MVFSSATFLFLFLPIVFLTYTLVPNTWKNTILLLASICFYAFGEPIYVLLLLFTAFINWFNCLLIETNRENTKSKRIFLITILINCGILIFFKYIDFIIITINSILHLNIPCLNIPLPIGISFFIFQTISYTTDIYRGKYHAEKSFISLATFICLFPQLIAGPIVLYGDIINDLSKRHVTITTCSDGITRFIIGLSKKVLIANPLGEIVLAFQIYQEKTILFCWLYAISFMLQIYFDFSGYSDMAIGLGKMFGFHFPENFNYPYMSQSITEFWRRWHISLGKWFKEYVYIPLGGNRSTKLKWFRNLMIVWFLTGIWHGAAWNFILWGLIFGFLLIIEKLFLLKILDKTPVFLKHIYVLFIVMISFVIFNDSTHSQWFYVLKGMFTNELPFMNIESIFQLRNNLFLIILACIGTTNLPKRYITKIRHLKIMNILEPILLMGLFIIVTSNIVNGSFNPFLYFKF